MFSHTLFLFFFSSDSFWPNGSPRDGAQIEGFFILHKILLSLPKGVGHGDTSPPRPRILGFTTWHTLAAFSSGAHSCVRATAQAAQSPLQRGPHWDEAAHTAGVCSLLPVHRPIWDNRASALVLTFHWFPLLAYPLTPRPASPSLVF